MNEWALVMLCTDLCDSLCTVTMDKMGLVMAYRRAQCNEQETLHLPAVSCLLTNVPSLNNSSTRHWLSIALKREVICDMSREQMKCVCKHFYVEIHCAEYVVMRGCTMYAYMQVWSGWVCLQPVVWLMAQKEARYSFTCSKWLKYLISKALDQSLFIGPKTHTI